MIKSNRLVQWTAIIYLYQFLILAGASFLVIQNTAIFSVFAERTGITLSGLDFSIWSLLAALVLPLVLIIKDVTWKRAIYIGCGIPIGAFTVPYGVWLYATNTFNLLFVVYMNIFFSFVIIAGSCFRRLLR